MSTSDGKVVLGASVTLRTEPEGETVCYRIVEAKEADIPNGKLSVSAPLWRRRVVHGHIGSWKFNAANRFSRGEFHAVSENRGSLVKRHDEE